MIADGSTLAGELVPEGLEDVSLESDARLHIQVKSRSEHLLSELELIEPELFFRFDPTVADRLAEHILNGTV